MLSDEHYKVKKSPRYMILPDSGESVAIAVFSYDGLKGGIVEEDCGDGAGD